MPDENRSERSFGRQPFFRRAQLSRWQDGPRTDDRIKGSVGFFIGRSDARGTPLTPLGGRARAVRAQHPGDDSPLGPTDAPRPVPAEKAQVAAVRQDLHRDLRRRHPFLERLDGDEGIVPGGQDQRRDANPADQRQGRGAPVIIPGVGEAAAGDRVQVVEQAHGQASGQAQRRRGRRRNGRRGWAGGPGAGPCRRRAGRSGRRAGAPPAAAAPAAGSARRRASRSARAAARRPGLPVARLPGRCRAASGRPRPATRDGAGGSGA
jgi:hypothetical protein